MSKQALGELGLAITNAGYIWTPEMRSAYEKGIRESQWVGLTFQEIDDCIVTNEYGHVIPMAYYTAIEAKLKEKNT